MRLALVVCAAALALAGCGGDGGGEAGAPAEGAPRMTVEVRLTEFEIEPPELTLEEPGVYRFRAVNAGSIIHALRLRGQDVDVETAQIGAGRESQLTVELERGTYELICPVGNHEDQGMTATLVVGGDGTTATDGDDDDGDDGGGGDGEGDDGYGGYGGG